jgi:hypothetical protein
MLPETHVALAQQLEASGHFREAESHYCEGGDWKSAVQMYRANNLWEDATRVAKTFGGPTASKQVRIDQDYCPLLPISGSSLDALAGCQKELRAQRVESSRSRVRYVYLTL